MKFRGKMIELHSIQNLVKVITTISKMTKEVCIRITPNHIYFILNDQSIRGGGALWCEIDQGHFFNEYNMEGVSDEHNEIYLNVATENFLRALRSAQNSKCLKIKLTKKYTTAYLTHEVELPTTATHVRNVTHDVPVQVIPRRLWDDYQEPQMPPYDISVYLPNLRILRNVLERMKNIFTFLEVKVNRNQDMSLSLDAPTVLISTHFKDLSQPTDTARGLSNISEARVRIDIRKFLHFLTSQSVNPMRVICNVAHKKCLHLFLMHEDIALQYILPHIAGFNVSIKRILKNLNLIRNGIKVRETNLSKGPTPGIRRSCICTHVRVSSKGFHVRNGLKLEAKSDFHQNSD
ncbi:HUS1 [Cordylochernes scorpioides]|uniref:HUS1 n=1 Tax=Cordylochernes scorpioides TaxID=51811 RepID=A0ABY6K3D9_9ARAC|nr:HUS1 [Cordylochernes scorpioides]